MESGMCKTCRDSGYRFSIKGLSPVVFNLQARPGSERDVGFVRHCPEYQPFGWASRIFFGSNCRRKQVGLRQVLQEPVYTGAIGGFENRFVANQRQILVLRHRGFPKNPVCRICPVRMRPWFDFDPNRLSGEESLPDAFSLN